MRTIKSSDEISRIFKEGKRISTPGMNVIALKSDSLHDRHGRVAFIAGKKLGNAVWRNRAKRRMREVCRAIGGPVEDWDILFVARKKVATMPFDDLVRTTRRALTQQDK